MPIRPDQAISSPTYPTDQAQDERIRLLALTADVGTALTTRPTLPEMLQGCTEALVAHLDAAFARVWVLDEADGVLVLKASAGLYTHLDGPHGRVPVGQFKIGLIAQEGQPHLTNSVVGDPRVSDQAWARREGMIAFAGYPLIVENYLVGVVAMFARHPLSEVTLETLGAVANEIALGIEGKRTGEALRASEERLRDAEARLEVALSAGGIGVRDSDVTMDRRTPVSAIDSAIDSALAATARLEALIANIQAGIIVEDEGGQVVLANQAFCDMMNIDAPPRALTGANVVPMARGTGALFADPDAFVERALHLRRHRETVAAEELRLTDGRVWERDYVPVFSGEGRGAHLWVFRDVTERRRAEERIADYAAALEAKMRELEEANAALGTANARLEALATTDGLTGLLNQRVFMKRLAEEFRRARRYGEPLSLIVLDVDRFKAYNDDFGHLAGNSALQGLAGVLREHARETDLAARFGGEEFALILPHTEAGEAAALAERLRDAVAGADWGAGRAVTASFGVCALTPEMDSPQALIACADAAMYRAKARGRNRVERV